MTTDEREMLLETPAVRELLAERAREQHRWMPCGHQLRFWSPLEGTISGAIAFQRDPEKSGFCEVCRARREARVEMQDRCAQAALDTTSRLLAGPPTSWPAPLTLGGAIFDAISALE